MKINIQAKKLNLGQTFKHNIKVKIRQLFQHNMSQINHIDITLADINGPKGGPDKECKVNVVVGGGKSILVSSREISAYKAATQAIRKASFALKNQRQKAKSFKHIPLAGLNQNEAFAEA